MKTWKRWIVKWLGIKSEIFKGNLDTEQAIRSARKQGFEAGYEKGVEDGARIQFIPAVYIDQAGQKAAQSQIGCYEKPERTTGPVQGIRRRAMSREFQAHPGILMRHEAEMHKKAQTRQLDPETVILPVTKQPQKPHLHRLYAEPDSTFNAL